MRLIDADELLKALKKEFRQNDYIKHDGYFEFKNIVENAPTIDTERHGKWKIEQENMGTPIYVFTCSNCGEMFCDEDEYIVNSMHYCMNCGAKMNEVVE